MNNAKLKAIAMFCIIVSLIRLCKYRELNILSPYTANHVYNKISNYQGYIIIYYFNATSNITILDSFIYKHKP